MLLGRPSLVKGFMQLYSVEQKRSQALEAHAAAFSTIKVSPTPACRALELRLIFAQWRVLLLQHQHQQLRRRLAWS